MENAIEKATEKLTTLETLLASNTLYEAGNKAQLAETLAQQVEAKRSLEENELMWLEAQETLEKMLK
ncbi:hypothetical protein RZ66_06535 [[Haemophilus] ducreyi]|nr:hypothetical protein [[Haemophilus] ducreyi]AKO45858.1 hypothetical protein RZ66_06535 [[Haemophilus] ducreyi]